MLLAEVADQASQAAPLPAGDRLRMAARGRTVGAEASSYQALEVPEDRAQELHMLPLVAPVDKAHDPVLVGNRPVDPPVDTAGRIRRFYRPPDDTVRTELAGHSFSMFFFYSVHLVEVEMFARRFVSIGTNLHGELYRHITSAEFRARCYSSSIMNPQHI